MRLSHPALLGLVGLLGALAVGGIAALWPGAPHVEATDSEQTTELVAARLDAVETLDVDDVGLLPEATVVAVTATIDDTGEQVSFEMVDDTGDTFRPGQQVRLQAITDADGQTTYLVSDFRRDGPIALLAGLFIVSVIALGRWQGVRALVGLALTFLLIVGFIVPAILAGSGPVVVALVGSLAIMIVTLYLSHGLSRKTTAAVVGTAVALLLTGILAAAFTSLASLTGFTSEEARLANVEVGGLSLRGLLLAGIIIGGLGVLDDVTMSQSSTVFALHRADPRAGFGGLVRAALVVGRDHIAATVNTLFLAYAGASLPLLILFATGIDPFGTVITSEIVAVEVVRTLVGSIGLIAAVPVTTALAAGLVVAEPEEAAAEDAGGHDHGVVPASPPGQDDDAGWVRELREAYRLPPDT
ncbi:MAG: YibE/F family protein [Euzebyales bacterium]|nr:YibE/F family protein [Euzebyales bacterium]